ncbi:hypothetical protein [Merdibacter massiliensis]|uniref:hypothetical protein n=1 Tax=Merdibacter massiliensis TaxID=1871030 RepID=UPI00117BD6C6|nr:hypothetical protein [Merdibacter massiliensis]
MKYLCPRDLRRGEMEEYMERFVNGKEFQRLFNEANPDGHIGYPKALQLLKKIKEMHGDCLLPSENVIPMTWVEEALGKGAYIRKKKGTGTYRLKSFI